MRTKGIGIEHSVRTVYPEQHSHVEDSCPVCARGKKVEVLLKGMTGLLELGGSEIDQVARGGLDRAFKQVDRVLKKHRNSQSQ